MVESLLVTALLATARLGSATPALRLPLRCETRAQELAFNSTAPEVCYSGRRFGGKSWIGCAKALMYACKVPGGRAALCREERASMEDTTLLTLRSEIVPPEMWAACWKPGSDTLDLTGWGGGSIHAFGLDKPGRKLGARYGLVVIDQAEQLSYAQFEIINSCATQSDVPFTQTLALFNPDSPDHWAYQRYRPDDGDGARLDNRGEHFADVVHVQPGDLLGHLSSESVARLDRMQGIWHLRLRLGLWAAFEGAVFDLWDPAVHVVATPAEWGPWGGFPPADWARYVGIDFGYEPDPFAATYWAEAPDGRLFCYRQWCALRQPIDQVAARLVALEAEELEALRVAARSLRVEREMAPYLETLNLAARYSDHHRGERAMLAQAGIATKPANKDILASLQTVLSLLKGDERGPRLFVVRGSEVEIDRTLQGQGRPVALQEEMGRYTWRTTGDAITLRASASGLARQLPRQVNDHLIDSMRYALHSLHAGGRVGVYT